MPKREIKEMEWGHIEKLFRKYNDRAEKENNKAEYHPINAYVMYDKSNFDRPYTDIQRTYEFTNDNKAFQSGMGGYSIFASCMDGVTDKCVRIENIGWTIQSCWMYRDEYDYLMAHIME